MNREELKIRTNDFTLQWRHCNGNGFRFSHLHMLTNKATIFLEDGLYWKLSTRRQEHLVNKNAALAVQTFS